MATPLAHVRASVLQLNGGNTAVTVSADWRSTAGIIFFLSFEEALEELQVFSSKNRSIWVDVFLLLLLLLLGSVCRNSHEGGAIAIRMECISQTFMQTRDQSQVFQMLLARSCTLLHNTPFGAQLKTEAKQREETIWLFCTDCLSKK